MCSKLLSLRWNTIFTYSTVYISEKFRHSTFSQQDLLSELVSGYTGNISMPIMGKKTSQSNTQLKTIITPIEQNLLVGKKEIVL